MINSSQEQFLLNDAVRMREEIDKDTGSAAVRLAVHSGMERGQMRLKKRFLSKSMAFSVAAAMIAAAVLFVLPYFHTVPQSAGLERPADWGELEVFRENGIYGTDVATLDSVIRSGYIQRVNQTTESEGYAITLNAVTADENRIIYFYTATTDEKQEIYSINSAKMKNLATDSYLNTTTQLGGNMKIAEPEKNHVFYGRGIVELNRTEPFPQHIEAEFRIASVNPGKMADRKTGTTIADMHYSKLLKVSFTLDSKFMQYRTQIVKPDLPFSLNGHEVVLSRVEMSPLLIQASIALKKPEENDWETRSDIFKNASFQEILSKVQGKSIQLSLVSGGGTEDGYAYAFASNWLDDPESLVLKIKERTGSKLEEINLKVNTK